MAPRGQDSNYVLPSEEARTHNHLSGDLNFHGFKHKDAGAICYLQLLIGIFLLIFHELSGNEIYFCKSSHPFVFY